MSSLVIGATLMLSIINLVKMLLFEAGCSVFWLSMLIYLCIFCLGQTGV